MSPCRRRPRRPSWDAPGGARKQQVWFSNWGRRLRSPPWAFESAERGSASLSSHTCQITAVISWAVGSVCKKQSNRSDPQLGQSLRHPGRAQPLGGPLFSGSRGNAADDLDGGTPVHPLTCAGCAAAWGFPLERVSPLETLGKPRATPHFSQGTAAAGAARSGGETLFKWARVNWKSGWSGAGRRGSCRPLATEQDPALQALLFSSARILELEKCHYGFHTDKLLPNQCLQCVAS